jgi:hypothetical protein
MARYLLDDVPMNTRLQWVEQGSHRVSDDETTASTRASGAATFSEKLGTAVGFSWAPALVAVSALRRARTFHPRGDLFVGRVEVDPAADASDAALASRLVGESLVRFSDSLSKTAPCASMF